MRSSMQLFQPLLAGDNFLENITWACWPTYKRVSTAQGGDVEANFTVSGVADSVLEDWFQNRLGCHFVETWGGVTAFMGRITRMVLSYNGRVLVRDLEPVRNSIHINYQLNEAAGVTTTAEATDSDSIALYGTRQLEKDVAVYMDSISAEAYRDTLLARLKEARAQSDRVAVGPERRPGQLQVRVSGYVLSLTVLLEEDNGGNDVFASDEIADIIAPADFVTEGTLTENILEVNDETGGYVEAWKRIQDIAALGGLDGSGNPDGKRWLAGCYQGRALDYGPADEETIFYRISYKQNRRLDVVQDEYGGDVPPALVQPGVMAFSDDIMPGKPLVQPLRDDPRATFIEKVTYDKSGVVIDGADADVRRLALQMALSDDLDRRDEYISGGDGRLDPSTLPGRRRRR